MNIPDATPTTSATATRKASDYVYPLATVAAALLLLLTAAA